mgnify:CR=1 FL=1
MNEFVLLLLAFLAITFLQSGYDKIADWNGNVSWLKGHFSQTFLNYISINYIKNAKNISVITFIMLNC